MDRICTKTNSIYNESNGQNDPYPCYYHDKSMKIDLTKSLLVHYLERGQICKSTIPFIKKKIEELS